MLNPSRSLRVEVEDRTMDGYFAPTFNEEGTIRVVTSRRNKGERVKEQVEGRREGERGSKVY